jgi:hypothetical protein
LLERHETLAEDTSKWRIMIDKSFRVTMAGGHSHTFDRFVCAIHALAPS